MGLRDIISRGKLGMMPPWHGGDYGFKTPFLERKAVPKEHQQE